ncbi:MULTISPECIES: PTS lactose/cellobiose transporter subunit IIA [Selenomonas]|uniref:PTS lactose/cellobiose transporter subunit IIA n=1 Tax=Selenomonas ruminis TaxID=2593411 RepID=A0A5D6WC67_9FIRM|nr:MULTISPECIES: PTS lactose/cellobiose transporter subunit IIA [unclassified Selenomonas]MBQ1867930.1 PTS lactose/cellobiose transporter subunit IIA [Selenomonas sp.]TYZ25072.1 PTS lactose/cellobiose transporter subunit IIA [Selenomonas sp. mPRGC5]
MEGLELTAFQIISSVGSARSCYIEAIQEAKQGNFDKAESLIAEGDDMFVEGHDAHANLLTKEAQDGPGSTLSLLILHAEDQLMSAEGFKTIALEFMDAYKRIETLEEKINNR